MTTVVTDHPEPSSSIIAQAAIQLPSTGDRENSYVYNPWFKGKCYLLCFHCHAPLYREPSSTNTHDEKCAKFPGKHDKEAMRSNDWKIIYVFGTTATEPEHLQKIQETFFEKIATLLKAK